MKLIIHTKYGKFEGKEVSFDQKRYDELSDFLNKINHMQYACFETENGEIVMTKPMIDDCIVELIK